VIPLIQDDPVTDTKLSDNAVLDEFEIPFGEWADQAVDWIDTRLGDGPDSIVDLLGAIEWPFTTLIDLIVKNETFGLENISWLWVVAIMFVIASLVRNVKVGVFVALALTCCGLLGNAYWIETARTIGFIFVAVVLCVMIGIPVGVACGRVDGVWSVVRPVLDAMQVVHSFVYMLPFIFFWGIGEASATMVTMVFALPPLIRLTNLGVRQVPEDVVEASRAYGAPEWRVLADVQLPLARPAIMTGLNQTLLLAISMLGIAAIMGAGGLGRTLFRALSNQDVALAASGGLAFFLVAVVLDRMSQSDHGPPGSLLHRIRLAWAHRRDPEALIPEQGAVSVAGPSERFTPVIEAERMPMLVTAIGAVVTVVSVFLTWSSDAGYMSAYGRRSDEEALGSAFNGLSASGGSWFGFMTLGLGLFILASVVTTFLRPGRGPRWMTTDGVVIAALAVFLMNLIHLLADPSPLVIEHTIGLGLWLAVAGSLVATVGSLLWLRVGPHSAIRPLSADIGWGRVVGAGAAVLVLFIAAISGWSWDGREDVVITDDLQARIDELEIRAQENPADAGAIAAELSAMMAEAQAEGAVVTDGLSGDGPRLGLWSLLGGVVAWAAAAGSAGLYGRDERLQWQWSSIAAGLGTGVALAPIGWIATHVRSADPNYVSGIGAFLAACGGLLFLATSMIILKVFRRTKQYGDLETGADVIAPVPAPTPESAVDSEVVRT
jgi:glycine betaine/proline transport system permease protein